MYHNALIAIDGSEVGNAVLSQAAEIVDPKGTVTVIKVIDDVSIVMAQTAGAGIEIGMTLDPSIAEDMVTAQRTDAEDDLASARVVLEGLGLKHIRTVVCEGLAGPTIVSEADRRRTDVVLMGTHGRGGFKRALLGSVADHVMRHLGGTPLLLVRPPDEARKGEAVAIDRTPITTV
jgi:nucleotide-binding universal stress UspA family protein